MKALEETFSSRTFRRIVLPGIVLTLGIHPSISAPLATFGKLYGIDAAAVVGRVLSRPGEAHARASAVRSAPPGRRGWGCGAARAVGVISVQVLSELTSVGRRKLHMSWEELREALDSIRELCRVEPLTEQTHAVALQEAARYDLSWDDALIVAAALLAECSTLYSADMHGGLRIKRTLKVVNPFK